jgi:hypothetical protein
MTETNFSTPTAQTHKALRPLPYVCLPYAPSSAPSLISHAVRHDLFSGLFWLRYNAEPGCGRRGSKSVTTRPSISQQARREEKAREQIQERPALGLIRKYTTVKLEGATITHIVSTQSHTNSEVEKVMS